MEDDITRRESKSDAPTTLPECERIPYEKVFYNPNGTLPGNVAHGFYAVARHTAQRIVSNEAREDVEGIAVLYLFRHYLELTLKDIVYNLGQLKTRSQNCPEEDRRAVKAIHSLNHFWREVQNQCQPKVGNKIWQAWDTKLVTNCVAAFDEVDPNGERFRYHIENHYGVLLSKRDDVVGLRCPNLHKFNALTTQRDLAREVFRCGRCYEEKERRAKENGDQFNSENAGTFRVRDQLKLAVSWTALLIAMEQAHTVLEAINSYLAETYFQNEEWEEIQNSW